MNYNILIKRRKINKHIRIFPSKEYPNCPTITWYNPYKDEGDKEYKPKSRPLYDYDEWGD